MYDVIVIGARCAGAPTAMLLAARGYKVALVDRSTFPSDMPISTHLIHPPGIAALRRWGLLDEIRATGCPAISTWRMDAGSVVLNGCPPPADGTAEGYAPRRIVLDQILVTAAVRAGAALREGFSVEELLVDDGRVRGVRGQTMSGGHDSLVARLVVGADGPRSTVAKLTGAPEYNLRPELMGTYFTYWSGVRIAGFDFSLRDHRAAYGWMTNDGLALIGVNWAIKDFRAVRGNVEASYLSELARCAPALAESVRSGRRVAKWLGGAVRNFFRKSHGPGWALVGDAGYHKDPCTAAGITDAFRDAESVVEAIDEGLSGRSRLEQALAAHEWRRNEVAMPLYDFTCQQAAFEPMSVEMLDLLNALQHNAEDTSAFFGLFAQTTRMREFFDPANVARILGRRREAGESRTSRATRSRAREHAAR